MMAAFGIFAKRVFTRHSSSGYRAAAYVIQTTARTVTAWLVSDGVGSSPSRAAGGALVGMEDGVGISIGPVRPSRAGIRRIGPSTEARLRGPSVAQYWFTIEPTRCVPVSRIAVTIPETERIDEQSWRATSTAAPARADTICASAP